MIWTALHFASDAAKFIVEVWLADGVGALILWGLYSFLQGLSRD